MEFLNASTPGHEPSRLEPEEWKGSSPKIFGKSLSLPWKMTSRHLHPSGMLLYPCLFCFFDCSEVEVGSWDARSGGIRRNRLNMQ